MKKLAFTKMQAVGNDYIYFNCFDPEVQISAPEELAVSLSKRNFGIGSDGIVLILPTDKADAKMRMFNADGSEGLMCGNAIRCVAKYLYDNRIANKTTMTIDTLSGIKTLILSLQNSMVSSVKVDMGQAIFEEGKTALTIANKTYDAKNISMGNPHAVVFCTDVDSIQLSGTFSVNIEFVEVLDKNRLKMRVWERGSGETLGCGTGACASAVAAVLDGYCDKNTDISVLSPGGELIINFTNESVFMTGDCQTVFEGTVQI